MIFLFLLYVYIYSGYCSRVMLRNPFGEPNSLQFTGHPFAKPHVPCVVANHISYPEIASKTASKLSLLTVLT